MRNNTGAPAPGGKWKSFDRLVAAVFSLWCVLLAGTVLTDPATPWLVDRHEDLSGHLARVTPVTRVWSLVGSVVGLVGIVGVLMDKRRPLAIVACCALLQVLALLHSVVRDPAWWPILIPPMALAAYFTARFWMREMIPRYR